MKSLLDMTNKVKKLVNINSSKKTINIYNIYNILKYLLKRRNWNKIWQKLVLGIPCVIRESFVYIHQICRIITSKVRRTNTYSHTCVRNKKDVVLTVFLHFFFLGRSDLYLGSGVPVGRVFSLIRTSLRSY